MFTFENTTYKSLNTLYNAYKTVCPVSSPSLKQRLEGGWSIEKALTEPKGFMPGKPFYIFDGKKYPSIDNLFKAIQHLSKVSKPLFVQRVNDGMSIEEALVSPKKKTGTTFIVPQEIEGITYITIREIAEAYNVKFNTMFKRYSRGLRGETLVMKTERKDYAKPEKVEAIKEKQITKHAKPVEFNGIKYRSVKQMINEHGVRHCTYLKRRERGLSIGQALGLESVVDGRSKAKGVKRYEYQGKEYTAAELAEISGIPENTVRDRLKRGGTVEQSMSREILKKGVLTAQREVSRVSLGSSHFEVVVGGVVYKSYKTLADAYGMKDYVVRQRIVDYHYTPEEAVTREGKFQSFEVDGEKFEKLQDAAEHYGLQVTTLRVRRMKGWTPRQIVGIDTPPNISVYEWEGKEYYSIKEISEAVGIRVSLLSSRISKGLSVQEAIELGASKIVGSGRYNNTILERDPELAKKSCILYLVCIIVNEKLRYKVGITTNTLRDRLAQESVLWEEIVVGKGTLLECFNLEQQIHDLMDDKKDKSFNGSDMAGYTEIFDFDDDEVESVKELIVETLQ